MFFRGRALSMYRSAAATGRVVGPAATQVNKSVFSTSEDPEDEEYYGSYDDLEAAPLSEPLGMDVLDRGHSIELQIDAPGMKDTCGITVDKNILTVRGTRIQEVQEGNDSLYYSMEKSYGNFERSIDLPVSVDLEAISAQHEDGVLKITLPRIPQVINTARTIEIR